MRAKVHGCQNMQETAMRPIIFSRLHECKSEQGSLRLKPGTIRDESTNDHA